MPAAQALERDALKIQFRAIDCDHLHSATRAFWPVEEEFRRMHDIDLIKWANNYLGG